MGQNVSPFEVAVGVPDIYVAADGEAMPDLSAAPAGNWEKIVDKTLISEDGVQFRLPQTWEYDAFRTAGVTAPLKGALTQEDLEIELQGLDWSAAALARILLGPSGTVTDTAAGSGTAGNLNFEVYNGPTQRHCAVLCRWDYSTAAAAETDDFAAQLEIPKAVIEARIDSSFTKGAPVMAGALIRALYDLANSKFATFRFQDAAASA